MKNKKNLVIVIAAAAILAVILVTFIVWKSNDRKSKGYQDFDVSGDKDHMTAEEIKKHNEDVEKEIQETLENIQVNVEESEDFVEPGKDTLAVDKIQGFVPDDKKTETAGNNKQDDDKNGESDSKNDIPAIDTGNPELVIEYVGRYTGPFVEDGSNEPIIGGLAILVTNESDKMLQAGIITMTVNKSLTAVFNISNLPAGTTTMVLEKDRMLHSENSKYEVTKIATGYAEDVPLHEKEFEITGENGKLKLKNLTDKTYSKVYVYYKYLQLGGAYYGGITFRTPFENVEPGQTLEEVASHFSTGGSRISMVEIIE